MKKNLLKNYANYKEKKKYYKMRKTINLFKCIAVLFIGLSFAGCATIVNQDEVGVRTFAGKFSSQPSSPGLKLFAWPIGDIQKLSIRTQNLEVRLDLPSKEGLNVSSEISILYRLSPNLASKVLEEIGANYEKDLILPVFRSSAADVTAQFDAKDMHTGKRSLIEKNIRDRMTSLLDSRGFKIDAVLMKTINLPSRLASSIEAKLQAEQDAQRMNFVLEQEKKEAERKLIEAKGVSKAQKEISKGLSHKVLQFQSIQAFRELSQSPNTKTIISDGKSPMMLPVIENKSTRKSGFNLTSNP
jgi:regulator of protease activity HflC (stomatin/prohibitin superfamily)